MFKPDTFRFIILAVFCLSIGLVFATQLPIVRSKSENTIIKSAESNEIELIGNQNLLTLSPSPSPTPEIPHTLVGSYYLTDENIEAKLLLNNKGNTVLEVQPTLYNKQGQELQLPSVTVEPQNFRFINLNDWAAIGGESFKSGNIKLFHYGKDLVLGAQIYLTDETKSLTFEEKLAEKGKFDSHQQEAVWWMPSNDAKVKVVLTNTTNAPFSVTGKLAKKPNNTGSPQTFGLAAHQTKVLDLREDFTDGNQFANAEIIALSLQHSGVKDALLARVMVAEVQRGYSNVVQFSNPNNGSSSEYQGVGFQIEDIANQQLTPVISVRNVGTATATVTAKVPYTRADGTKDSITLPTEQLSGGEMRLLKVQRIIQRVRQENIKVASLEITYDTAPGSVIAAAHSVSDDHNQVFRVPMWDPLGQRSPTGGYPWHIEGTSATETYIKNIADYEEDYVAFLVWQNGGIYMIGLKSLAAHETVHIDVKKLRDEQIPDERGRTIPLYISSGQLQWTLRRKDNLPDDDARANLSLIGRSEQVDLTKKIVNNYACQNCCAGNFVTGYITPYPGDAEFGQNVQYEAYELGQTCYGSPYSMQIPSPMWSSSSQNIAVINTNGLAATVGVGQTNITASWHTTRFRENQSCPPGQVLWENGEEPDQCNKEESKETKGETTSNLAACGTCVAFGATVYGVSPLTVKPKVQRIQYQEPGTSNYIDITGTLYVLKETSVNFKAIPNPTNATFPTGQPFWSGTSGATGTGETKSVTFSTVSSSTSDYKTVIASNGTPITVNVIVYELTGTLTPQDNFTGRSQVRYGVAEKVDLNFSTIPSLTYQQIGELEWKRIMGSSQITNNSFDGSGLLTAPETSSSEVIKIEVRIGPSKGNGITYNKDVVAPNGAVAQQLSGTSIRHNRGFCHVATNIEAYLRPTDVSFSEVLFFEGETSAIASGYYANINCPQPPLPPNPNCAMHPLGGTMQIINCNILTGCFAFQDIIDTGDGPPPCTNGDFVWDIPWNYVFGAGSAHLITTARHHQYTTSPDRTSVEKAGAGPFTKRVSDRQVY